MTPEPRPAAVPFDPGSGELPPALESVLIDSASPILLLVAAEADDAAAHVAIALAEARAARGLATVLSDADFDAPRLHRLLDEPNLEGLVDVFLFGASLERVTVQPEKRRFTFAPAGAYAPDPAEVLQSPRWDRIAEEVTGDGALLLVFLPAAAPGARELSRRVGRAVVLGDDRGAERAVARLDPGCRILAAVQTTVAAEPEVERTTRPDSVWQGGATAFHTSDLDVPVVIRTPKPRRSTAPILLAIALVLALAAGAWFGYQALFGSEAPVATAAPAQAATAAERGALLETPIPYSVAVEAHQDMESATYRARLLSRAEPEISFHLAPVSVRGVLYFRLLAGPFPDRETGMAVMRRLVDAGHKTGMDDWAVRPTTHAFFLGDFDSEADARARTDALAEDGVPAYVVPLRYASGARRYRVYGGAYENQAEADVMREMLENAGEPAQLIPRIGEPVA
ncbi:MAG: SPOR domain-containing protein [Gemmatimonadetes bacterium]|nr:SPOR domain-containing protein [Gemmatimonadota bacterium]